MTADDRRHMARVAGLDCSMCGSVPVQVHHIRRGTEYKKAYATIPLCPPCHDALHQGRKHFRDFEEAALEATLRQLYPDDDEVFRKAGR